MNLATLDITPDEAFDKLCEYNEMIAEERTAEDQAIAMGYRAAARGLQVIRLTEVIAAGGYFDTGMPKMAIVRADASECFVRWDGPDLIFADHDNWNANRGALVGERTVRVTMAEGSLPPVRKSRWFAANTVVPIIPPRLRPRRNRLAHSHILWEVEQWNRTPPKDPALLRHIRGDLWSVLAVWDLTELERAVLSQR